MLMLAAFLPEGRRRRLVGGLAAILLTPVAGPLAAQTLVGDGSVVCGQPYTIVRGDTLSGVAARAYGDPMLYRILVDTNRDALGGDPERIEVGMTLAVPCVDAGGAVLTPEKAAETAAGIEAAVAAEGPLTPDELDALFGPVALFPDPVLTPLLVAVTFPLDVVKAARFVAAGANLSDEERAAKAAGQNWDESVRELAAAFPALLTRMNENIDWTEQAGEAVVAQTDGVLDAIQRLRAKAKANGYLVDNEAQKIEEVNDKIVIAPASPGVVYVPTYDSKVVYTTPVVGAPVYHYGYGYDYGPGYVHHDDDWQDALVAGGILLGGAIILDEIFDDDDWHGWNTDDNIDWDRGDITIDRGDINIDRGDISIGDGERPAIGDGDRPRAGGGDRVSIGASDRPQVDRGALAASGERAGERSRMSVSTPASRDVARQKIETRKSTGAAPANMMPSPINNPRPATSGFAQDRTRSGPAPSISRPTTKRTPTARAPTRSSAFDQPSRSRPAASSSRGRASMSGGGRGGGGRGGGGRAAGGGGGRR